METPDPNYFKEHPYSGTQYYIKPRWPEFYEYLQATYPGLRLSEQMYRYFYGGPGICPVCGKPTSYINFNKGYNICCSLKCSRNYDKTWEKVKKTNLERYGVEHCQQNAEIRKKTEQTCIEKYGAPKPLQNKQVLNKMKQTCMDRYGVEFAAQIEGAQEKSRKTCMERYGVEHVAQAESVKEKIRNTNIERYGVPAPMLSPEIQKKSKDSCLRKYGKKNVMKVEEIKQKLKEDLIKKYGGLGLASPEVREKIEQTNLERYGVKNPLQNKEIQQKASKSYKNAIIERHDFLIGYTPEGDWICKCPHPECDKCTEKYYTTSERLHVDRSRVGIELCTRLFPIGSSEHTISNISQQIFKELDEQFKDYTTHYASKDFEYKVGNYNLDYYVEELKLVIEFNGDYWHANPNKYSADWIQPTTGRSAQYIWDRDKKRKEYLESLGYKVIIIWESDLENGKLVQHDTPED